MGNSSNKARDNLKRKINKLRFCSNSNNNNNNKCRFRMCRLETILIKRKAQ